MAALVLMAVGPGASGALAAQKLERFYVRGPHQPSNPVQGPDGAVWFTLVGAMGRVSPDGRVTVFRTPHLEPFGTAANLDGALWFLDGRRDIVSRIDTAGHVSVVSKSLPKGAAPWGIAPGGDGNLWITEPGVDGSLWFALGDGVGRVTPAGALRRWKFRVDEADGPSIAATPDGGALAATGTAVLHVSPTGTLTRLRVDPARPPQVLANGTDADVWFTFFGATSGIGRMSTDGTVRATWRDPFGEPVLDEAGLALDAAGDVWASDSTTDSLERLSAVASEPGPVQPLLRRALRRVVQDRTAEPAVPALIVSTAKPGHVRTYGKRPGGFIRSTQHDPVLSSDRGCCGAASVSVGAAG